MRVLFAAGGTAGHINPALAIADKLMEVFPKTEILFVGKPDGMEKRLVTKAGYNFCGVEMWGFERGFSLHSIKIDIKAAYCYLFSARRAVKKIIREFKPDLAVGTGGYVTATVLKNAISMGIKTVAHESNSYPGMATKMLAGKADRILLACEDAKKYLKTDKNCVVTGNPLRSNIPIEARSAARKRLGLDDGFTVLSFGGSLGANRITEAVAGLIAREQQIGGINHIHSYGNNNRELFYGALEKNGVRENERLTFKPYIDNMYTCMCAADLIISRAGAMTITELTEIGRAAILVPYPNAAENHQYYNALTLQNARAAMIIEDKDLTSEKLIAVVEKLYNNRSRLAEMETNAKALRQENAVDKIISEIIEVMDLK